MADIKATATTLDAARAEAASRVKVYVPREVAYDLKKMNQVTKSVLGKLGCDGCHSGRLIDFLVIEDFVVNPRTLDVQEMLPGQGMLG